jgi:maltooligosyltrehalose trehalohydrolase
MAIGAEVTADGVHFRVWAPKRSRVDVVIDGVATPLQTEPNGYFSRLVAHAAAGTLYRFRLDGEGLYPDPASRWQPAGPDGPSQVVDPTRFRWTDGGWPGVTLRGQVIYEMHVGTFTREGTWRAATAALDHLREVCSVVEMMPVADFAGTFGWGYDGVDFFAPTRLYGEPDDLRAFVDRAHSLGLGVILDVVYNHAGPSGNYLTQFSDAYFSGRHKTDWGEALNYDAEGNQGTREFFLANAGYWIDEFRFDGLRLDATQFIFDDSRPHILEEIGRRVRAQAGGRNTVIIAENEPQDARLIRPAKQGGYALDAVWNDDLHHSAYVALTGHSEAYFSDHRGAPQEFVSAAKHGYLFQGQMYSWQKARRGVSGRGLAPECFVTFLENHDQVANTAFGKRLHLRAHPGRLRALTAFVLLGPGTPMLFQGQEFASSADFVYFADHAGDLAAAVRRGREEFMCQFPSVAALAAGRRGDDPSLLATFTKCKLDDDERNRNVEAVALHRDLFALRRGDPTLSSQGAHGFDGAVIGPSAFVIRFFGQDDAADRLLLVNLGAEMHFVPMPEPLLAASDAGPWSLMWSSESPVYGGAGMAQPDTDEGWLICGESAALLTPSRRRP